MPIRFRCAYCSQLMGIARRKAGTVVSCPTCHGQVVVPDPGPGAEDPPKADNGNGPPALFERGDFDELFGPGPVVQAAPPAPAPAVPLAPSPPALPAAIPEPAWQPNPAETNFDVERINSPLPPQAAHAGRPGVWLSPTALTLLSLLAVVLLALAFVGGLLMGRSLGG